MEIEDERERERDRESERAKERERVSCRRLLSLFSPRRNQSFWNVPYYLCWVWESTFKSTTGVGVMTVLVPLSPFFSPGVVGL